MKNNDRYWLYIRQNKLYRDPNDDGTLRPPFSIGYFGEMMARKKRSVYNVRFAMKEPNFESCQDMTRFARRFVDVAITAAIKIVAIMVR